jgi:hypothetical protein
MPEPPQVLREGLAGRYDVERELGEGGMATVYLARDVRHGRMVAIKVIRPELVGMLGTDRFPPFVAIAALNAEDRGITPPAEGHVACRPPLIRR